jgi:hypothetical protein
LGGSRGVLPHFFELILTLVFLLIFMLLDDFTLRSKVTADLYFKRLSLPAYAPLGNVSLFKQEYKLDRTPWTTARKGLHQETHEEISKVSPRWSFKLNERFGEQLAFLNLARATTSTQATRVAADTNLVVAPWDDSILGTTVYCGFLDISSAVVKSLATGMITFLTHGPTNDTTHNIVLNSANVTAQTIKSYTLLEEAFVSGEVRLVISSQNNLAPEEIILFSAMLKTTDWGDNDGEKVSEYTLELLQLDSTAEATL